MTDFNKEDWVEILNTTDSFDANLIKSKLNEQGIATVAFDHQDSMMTMLNASKLLVTLYVHKNDVEKAQQIIKA